VKREAYEVSARTVGLYGLSGWSGLWSRGRGSAAQLNCAAECCTIYRSGHANSKARIYLRLRYAG